MSEELKQCPLCGSEVHGHVCGGVAAFGCGEWEYEIECECGILFNPGTYETPEEAEDKATTIWNRRTEQ